MNPKNGLLLVLVDPAPSLEEELNAWYDSEHLPERASLPGFVSARRFTSLGDGPQYAALYDLRDLGVLESSAYLAVSGANFSPWTRRVTALSQPVRITAQQVGGPVGPTGEAPRLLILKFRGTTSFDAAAIAGGLEANFAGRSTCRTWRVFEGVGPEPGFMLALVEFGGIHVPELDLEVFGPCARCIDMAASYRPYRG